MMYLLLNIYLHNFLKHIYKYICILMCVSVQALSSKKKVRVYACMHAKKLKILGILNHLYLFFRYVLAFLPKRHLRWLSN